MQAHVRTCASFYIERRDHIYIQSSTKKVCKEGSRILYSVGSKLLHGLGIVLFIEVYLTCERKIN